MNGVTTATFAEQYLDRVMPEVEKALSEGTNKHGDGINEKDISRRIISAQNHIGKHKAGLDRDSESGILHLVAAAVQMLIASQHLIDKPHLDDRPHLDDGPNRDNLMNHKEMYEFIKKGGPVAG